MLGLKTITFFIFFVIGYSIYFQFKTSKQLEKELKKLEADFQPDFIKLKDCIPKNKQFLWGVATASHQNEGNLQNNWTAWEDRNNLEKSGIGTNSWEFWEHDLARVKKLGCKAYRFSIEWSRIIPLINKVDYTTLNKYKTMILKMKEMDIEPILTLHHFTRPIWVDVLYSGLHNEEIIKEFEKYVAVVAKELGHLCQYWITFNEPILECLHGYVRGTRPPGLSGDFKNFELAIANICEMHSRAYNIIHLFNKMAKVSIAKNFSLFRCDNSYDYLKNRISQRIYDYYNHSILRALTNGELNLEFNLYVYKTGLKLKKYEWANKLDFIGLNHYNLSTVCISYNPMKPFDIIMSDPSLKYPISDMGWDICGHSMYLSLLDLAQYKLPIFITENGCADNTIDNKNRISFLKQSLKGITRAENECDVDVIGFCYWTLHDNFEWEDGYEPKFGLYKINFDKLKMNIKNKNEKDDYTEITKGGEIYKNIIELWEDKNNFVKNTMVENKLNM